MTAPFRDPQPEGDIEIWPPVVALSPELTARYARRAHGLRLAVIHSVFDRLFALLRWKF